MIRCRIFVIGMSLSVSDCAPGAPIPHNLAQTFDGPPSLERSG